MGTKRVNSSLEAGLEKEKLKSETLLSEKLLFEKDLQRIKDQLTRLTGKNEEMDALVRSASAKLQSQELEYNRMKRENTSLHQIKKQRQELTQLNNELQNQLQILNNAYAQLEARNSELEHRVAFLQDQNKTLTDDLNRVVFAAVDQSQIQAVKGKNEKLTIKAKQTKKLLASFDVASNLKNLSFRIMDATGSVLTQSQGSIAYTTTPSENNFMASADHASSGTGLQRVDLSFTPKQRLKTGVYTIEILNDNLYVGSLRVKLK